MISKELILKRIRKVYSDYEKFCKEKEWIDCLLMAKYALRILVDIYNSDKKIEEKDQMIYQDWNIVENYIKNLLHQKNIFVGVDLGKNKDTHVEKISIPKKNNFISIEEKEDEVVVQVTPKEEKYPFEIKNNVQLYASTEITSSIDSKRKNEENKTTNEQKLKAMRIDAINNCEETRILFENAKKLNGITYRDWNNLREIMDISFERILEEQNEYLSFYSNEKHLDMDIYMKHSFKISKNK